MMATYRLEVDSDPLGRGLRSFKRLARSKRDLPTIFSYNGVDFAVSTSGITFTAPAKGQWPTPVRATLRLLAMLAQSPPHGEEPTVMSFDGERLCVADCRVPASADEAHRLPVDTLHSMRLYDLLRLRSRYSDEDLERSGLRHFVEEAEQQRDRLVAKAAAILAKAGVNEDDLRKVIDEKTK
jgi:hypothetical protein